MASDVIVYLIRGTAASVSGFARSIALLKANFLPWSPADIVVFHEADFDPQTLHGRISGLPVRFLPVDFSSIPPGAENLTPRQRGYRHMCHFFANDIFSRPELANYRYQMRLDDDSYILAPVRINVFETMAQSGFRYGYRAVIRDKAPFCRGLWPAARDYFAKVPPVRDFRAIPELNMYYTNFEICDLAWFRGAAWQSFFAALEATGGIWRDRWGDAPIRYIGVRALLPDDQIRAFTEISYKHQSVWRAGHARRLPWDLLVYYVWVVRQMLAARFKKG